MPSADRDMLGIHAFLRTRRTWMPLHRKPTELILTPELVARAHRVVTDSGPPSNRTPMRDEDYNALLLEVLAGAEPKADLWLFAFGSLIWNPACAYAEQLPAEVPGWHRSFCLKLVWYRGTPERPGLMMGLDRGGLCRGLAYRIPRDQASSALSSVLRREISVRPIANQPRWLSARIGGARRQVLGFVANRQISNYVGRLSPEEAAEMIATGCGHRGSCAEYLLNTVMKLQEHGIYDRICGFCRL
jgi:cation transport protein ChaC